MIIKHCFRDIGAFRPVVVNVKKPDQRKLRELTAFRHDISRCMPTFTLRLLGFGYCQGAQRQETQQQRLTCTLPGADLLPCMCLQEFRCCYRRVKAPTLPPLSQVSHRGSIRSENEPAQKKPPRRPEKVDSRQQPLARFSPEERGQHV
jgi:hypothetical protein